MRRKLCVNILGNGVCGLSVACRLKEVFGNEISLVITSDKMIEETTSYVAGGLWEPYASGETSIDPMIHWSKITYNYYNHLFHSPAASLAGIQQLSVYSYSEEEETPFWNNIPIYFNKLIPSQLEALNAPKQYKFGYTYLSYVAEPRYFLNWMKNQLSESEGVVWENRTITSIDEQINMKKANDIGSYAYDIVINCTGLGSHDLLNDTDCHPIRGQILHVKAPWITSACTAGEIYVIPNRNQLIVGGTAQKNDWRTEVSQEDTERMWNGVCELYPSLHEATLEKVLVGLRPGRTSLRLESSVINRPPNTASPESSSQDPSHLLLVHCYGLGGSGFTLSRGLAEDIVANHILPYVSHRGNERLELEHVR